MVSAWYMDDDTTNDQRLDHHRTPLAPVPLSELAASTGVLYWRIEDVDNIENDLLFAKIRKDRGYTYSDEITCSPDKLPDYDKKLKMFYEEHLHTDEEIRLVLDGSGFFDVRDLNDNWIRIKVEKGDLIVLPAGSYHRFTLDTNVSHFVIPRSRSLTPLSFRTTSKRWDYLSVNLFGLQSIDQPTIIHVERNTCLNCLLLSRLLLLNEFDLWTKSCHIIQMIWFTQSPEKYCFCTKKCDYVGD